MRASVNVGVRGGTRLGATLGAFTGPILIIAHSYHQRFGIVSVAGCLTALLGPALGAIFGVATAPPQSRLATRILTSGIAGGIVGILLTSIVFG